MTTLRSRNLIVAGALAIAAAILTLLYVSNSKDSAKAARPLAAANALIATQDIRVGTPGDAIAGRLATVMPVPVTAVVPGALVAPSQLKGLVVTDTIYKGEQLTSRRFQTGQAQGIRARLRGGLRAIQVAGDPNQLLAGTLRDGDRVDVVASLADPTNGQKHLSRIVLRGVLVLAPPAGGSTLGSTDKTSVTLQVSDLQAQKLFFVVKNADWSLVLRPTIRPTDDQLPTVSEATLLGGGQ
jgi:Flp pilus assembly protein CpaB